VRRGMLAEIASYCLNTWISRLPLSH